MKGTTMASKEVDTVTTGDLVIKGMPGAGEALNALATGQRIFIENDEVTQADVIAKALNAKSVEELYAVAGLESTKDHLGEKITILGVQGARNSKFQENPLGFFLVTDAVNADGEQVALSVGSADGVIKLLKQRDEGWFPVVVEFTQSTKPTNSGYYPINITLDVENTKRVREGARTF